MLARMAASSAERSTAGGALSLLCAACSAGLACFAGCGWLCTACAITADKPPTKAMEIMTRRIIGLLFSGRRWHFVPKRISSPPDHQGLCGLHWHWHADSRLLVHQGAVERSQERPVRRA